MNNLELNKRLAEALGLLKLISNSVGDTATNWSWLVDGGLLIGDKQFNVITSAADREAVIEHYKVVIGYDFYNEVWNAFRAVHPRPEGYMFPDEAEHKDRTTAILNCFKKIVKGDNE